jgi:hypothetical protein
MKKVLFSLFLFCAMAVGVQAQSSSCAKSCAAKPAGASCEGKSSVSAADASAAAKLASTDSSIESKKCADGSVCYVRKVGGQNNEIASYVDVKYDASTNTFVNVSPSKSTKSGASCAPKNASAGGKSCCTAGAAASGSNSHNCTSEKNKPAAATTTSGTIGTKPPSKG